MSSPLLFLLLMLAQSGFSLMRQNNVSDKKCSARQLEVFSKQQNNIMSTSEAGGGYHLTVKEKLNSVALSKKTSHLTNKDQMVEYQSKYYASHCCESGGINFYLCYIQLSSQGKVGSSLHLFSFKLMLGAVNNWSGGLINWTLSGMSHSV